MRRQENIGKSKLDAPSPIDPVLEAVGARNLLPQEQVDTETQLSPSVLNRYTACLTKGPFITMNYSNVIWRAIMALCLLSVLTGLSACGNKGPLYIPEPPVQQQSAEPAEKPAEEK